MMHSFWTQNTRLHEDTVFGRLTLDCIEEGTFLLKYNDWSVHIFPQKNEIRILTEGSTQKTYFLERIVQPFLHLLWGNVLLHASAFAYRGKGFGLLAASGVGKSTLAAGFTALPKCRFITDDILALKTDSESGTSLIQPFSTQLAMRHAMFDDDDFVKNIEHSGYKKLLTMDKDKVQNTPLPLRGLIVLDDDSVYPPKNISFAQAVPVLLKQQMVLSNPPAEFVRMQFHDIMTLRCIQFYKMGISCKTRSDVDISCRQFFSLEDICNEK